MLFNQELAMQINEETAKELIEEKKRVNDLRVQLHENQTLFTEVMAEAHEIILSAVTDDPLASSSDDASEGFPERFGRGWTASDSWSRFGDDAGSLGAGATDSDVRGGADSPEPSVSGISTEEAAAWAAMASESQRAPNVSFGDGAGKPGVFGAASWSDNHAAGGASEDGEDFALQRPLWELQMRHMLHENGTSAAANNGAAVLNSAWTAVHANGTSAAVDAPKGNVVPTSARTAATPRLSMAAAAASGNVVAVEDGDNSRGPGRPSGSGTPSGSLHEEADLVSDDEAHLEFGSASDTPGLSDSVDVDQLTMDAESLLSVRYNCCFSHICYAHCSVAPCYL
jgi:hypothetical protein